MARIKKNSPNGIPTGWNEKKYKKANIDTNKPRIQLLRNKKIASSIDFFIGEKGLWVDKTFISQLMDGEQIIGKYKGDDKKNHVLFGIVHNEPEKNIQYIEIFYSCLDKGKVGNGLIFDKNKNLLEARLTKDKGIIFDDAEEGKKGMKLKTGDGIKLNKGKVDVSKDNKSIKNVEGKLTIGTLDCGNWELK